MLGANARVLIIRPGALGDTVLTEPVVSALRAACPGARIELVGRTDYLPLLVGVGLADSCRSFDSAMVTSLFLDEPHALPQYDVALAFLPDADGTLQARMLQRAGWAVVFDPRPVDGSTHIVDHLLASLRPLGVVPTRCDPRLARHADWATEARSVLGDIGPYVVMHPGSGGRGKLWPPERWAETAAHLHHARVVITAGPADDDTLGQVLCAEWAVRPVVVLEQPVTTLAGVIGGAVAYVGCDSGVTHLAAALGVPTVAIFGPTNPEIWGPRGAHMEILRGRNGTTASVAAAEVVAACQRVSGLI